MYTCLIMKTFPAKIMSWSIRLICFCWTSLSELRSLIDELTRRRFPEVCFNLILDKLSGWMPIGQVIYHANRHCSSHAVWHYCLSVLYVLKTIASYQAMWHYCLSVMYVFKTIAASHAMWHNCLSVMYVLKTIASSRWVPHPWNQLKQEEDVKSCNTSHMKADYIQLYS